MNINMKQICKHIAKLKSINSKQQIRAYLNQLTPDEVSQIQALMYMGQMGVDNIADIIRKKINTIGQESKEDEIDTIVSKSQNLEKWFNNAEIIIHG